MPGPVTSAASAGCHRLIRDFGASCVTSADEMAELAPLADAAPSPVDGGTGAPERSSDQVRVIDALAPRSARPVEDVAGRAGLSIAQVQSVLGALELEGTVAEREGGWIRLRR